MLHYINKGNTVVEFNKAMKTAGYKDINDAISSASDELQTLGYTKEEIRQARKIAFSHLFNTSHMLLGHRFRYDARTRIGKLSAKIFYSEAKKINTRDLLFNVVSVKSKGLTLKLKIMDTSTIMYLKGNYFSEENPFITLELFTEDGVKYHNFKNSKRYYDDIVILTHDLKSTKVLKDLKKAFAIRVTIQDNTLGTQSVCLNTDNYLNLSNNFSHE
jgi:hypothetical protein